mgnify:CR=1 FL=1
MEKWLLFAKEHWGIDLSAAQQAMFAVYESELMLWNEKMNLTAVRDTEGIRIKHFLDSLTCAQVLGDMNGRALIDIGTGAGFPGIPLKILFPEMRLVLVDSVGKKVDFCRHMLEKLCLQDSLALQARAEDLGLAEAHRERYDAAVARAVAGLPVLCEYLLPLVRPGGCILAQKGESAPDEAAQAEKAIRILGGGPAALTPVDLPGLEDRRYLIRIPKDRPTPPGFPRRTGVPSRMPIL